MDKWTRCVLKEMAWMPFHDAWNGLVRLGKFLYKHFLEMVIALVFLGECAVVAYWSTMWLEAAVPPTGGPTDKAISIIFGVTVIFALVVVVEILSFFMLVDGIYKPWRRRAEDICRRRYAEKKAEN